MSNWTIWETISVNNCSNAVSCWARVD